MGFDLGLGFGFGYRNRLSGLDFEVVVEFGLDIGLEFRSGLWLGKVVLVYRIAYSTSPNSSANFLNDKSVITISHKATRHQGRGW